MRQFWLIAAAFCLINFGAKANGLNATSIVHTLDYIARDYVNAVENGTVKDELEYAEMAEFSEALVKQISELNFAYKDSALILANAIKKQISEKQDIGLIAGNAAILRDKLIAEYDIKTAPISYPDIAKGKLLFKAACAQCHGDKGFGDGVAAKGLKPAPSNFHDESLMNTFSPFEIFNTVRMGIEGTAMAANHTLTDEEVWDIAFFTLSLQHEEKASTSELPEVSLKEISTLSDATFKDAGYTQEQIAALRTRLPHEASDVFLTRAENLFKEALSAYQNANYKKAEELAISAYLEGVEPIEARLRRIDENIVRAIEKDAAKVRLLIKKKAPNEEVASAIHQVLNSLKVAEAAMQESGFSFWMAFSIAFIILLREGLEAFLIIMVLLAILNKSGLQSRKKHVHLGWISAIAVGVILWMIGGKVIQSGIMHVELMEGVIGIVAVAVLIYVGFWLHSKSKASEWKKYVSKLVEKANGNGSAWSLAGLSFFVTFREVFESILFLSALQIQSKGTQTLALGSGIIVAFVVVLLLAIIALKFSARLPVQKLFQISAFTISLLAFVLAGKAIHSFQEAGFVSAHEFPIPPFEILGVYGTWETLTAQALVLALIFIFSGIKK